MMKRIGGLLLLCALLIGCGGDGGGGAEDIQSASDLMGDVGGADDVAPSPEVTPDIAASDTADVVGPNDAADDAGEDVAVGSPFTPVPAVESCAPAGEPCAPLVPSDEVFASYRKDAFIPHEVHPTELRDDPVDGGRFQIAAIAAVSGEVTEIRINGQDTRDMLVEPLLEWTHVWPQELVAGEPFWFAFHSRNPAWDAAATGHLTIRTAQGDALDADFPVQRAAVPITYVTTTEDGSALLIHAKNTDEVPHTLTGLLVGGRDVLAADIACVSDPVLAPGEAVLWTVPACTPWELGAAWTVVAQFADAPPSVGTGRVLKPVFPIEAWPRGSDCPLPGLEGDNFSYYRDGGIDTVYHYWGGYGECGFDRDVMFTETLPAEGDFYLLLGDDYPWQDPPPRLSDTSAVLGFLTGDESDWDYYDDDGFPKPELKARKSRALWRQYPELLTYNGAMTNKHIGAFAGMTDVQGVDIYNAGCAPHLFLGPARPDLRTPYDFLRNARDNHMPLPTWLYAQGLAGWAATVTAQEIENQAVSVAAAGGKGLMWFQMIRELADERPETWGAMQEMNWMLRSIRRYLREGDITGMVHADGEVVVEMVRAREALVVFVLSLATDSVITDTECVAWELGVGEEPHWNFLDQQVDVTLTLPEDFAAHDLFEIDEAQIQDLALPVRLDGRALTLLGVPLGMAAPTRVYVLGTSEEVRAHVAAELAARP